MLEECARLWLEGLVAKRFDSRYEPGKRSRMWLIPSETRSRSASPGSTTARPMPGIEPPTTTGSTTALSVPKCETDDVRQAVRASRPDGVPGA